jgi:hypothetical protein
VRVPVERREALLDEFERSSLSGVKFAALVGVKYPTFALWVQKRRKARAEIQAPATAVDAATPAPTTAQPIRLFEAFTELSGGNREPKLTIELPGGASLRLDAGSPLALAAELLRLLGSTGGRSC